MITEEEVKADILERFGKPHWNPELVFKAETLGFKLMKEFSWVNPVIESVRLSLIKLLDYDITDVLVAMRDKGAPGRNTDGLEWVLAKLEGGE